MKRLASVFLIAIAGCGPGEAPSTPVVSASSRSTIQAEMVEVRAAQVPIRVEVTGQVAAIYQATLSSKIQGTIEKVLVREGVSVAKGQVLVVLDNRDLRADLARMDAESENAKAHLRRMTSLYQKDAVSKQELENATRAFKVAEANRKAVLAQLSYTIVKAPFDGVITEKKVEESELASPGQPLLKMEDSQHLRLEATVAEGDVRAVSRGDRVPVLIDALGGQALAGTVSQILPAGDPQTHTFMVKVDLPTTTGLKSGMFGRLQLDKGVSQTTVIPKSALVERGELTGVFVVSADNVAHLRWVRVGRTFEQTVEVLSGLSLGERVFLDGQRGVDGAAVQILDSVKAPTNP